MHTLSYRKPKVVKVPPANPRSQGFLVSANTPVSTDLDSEVDQMHHISRLHPGGRETEGRVSISKHLGPGHSMSAMPTGVGKGFLPQSFKVFILRVY